MANKRIDRITCSFYENTAFDEQLLHVLDNISPNPRARCYKLKELAWEYIKQNMPNEIPKMETVSKQQESNEVVFKNNEVEKQTKEEKVGVFSKRPVR